MGLYLGREVHMLGCCVGVVECAIIIPLQDSLHSLLEKSA